jgi:hypothetical protein
MVAELPDIISTFYQEKNESGKKAILSMSGTLF